MKASAAGTDVNHAVATHWPCLADCPAGRPSSVRHGDPAWPKTAGGLCVAAAAGCPEMAAPGPAWPPPGSRPHPNIYHRPTDRSALPPVPRWAGPRRRPCLPTSGALGEDVVAPPVRKLLQLSAPPKCHRKGKHGLLQQCCLNSVINTNKDGYGEDQSRCIGRV